MGHTPRASERRPHEQLSGSGQPECQALRAIRVVVASDVRLYREGIEQGLRTRIGLDVISSLDELDAEILKRLEPDVLLLDVAMPGSLATTRRLVALAPSVKIVGFAVSEAVEDVVACAEAGMSGYVPREGTIEDVAAAVERATREELCCPPAITAALFRRLASLATSPQSAPGDTDLTTRERQIVALLDQGLSNKEIAERLVIEVATVKNHVHNILEKLQVHRRGEAAARVRAGLAKSLRRRSPAAPEAAPSDRGAARGRRAG